MNDERLLDCEFCGKRFFDIPDMALFGWDDARPMYACQSCDAAQQTLALDAENLAPFTGFFLHLIFINSDGVPPPVSAQVTQTVRRHVCKLEGFCAGR